MAPIYSGNTSIKAYLGNKVVQKMYLGNTLTFQNQVTDPTITYVSKTATSLTFTVTNNDTQTATIYYEHSDATPDAASVTVAAGTTSATQTITGLTDNTSYTVYAQATRAGAESSNVVNFTESTPTASWNQLGSEYDKSSTSSIRGTYNSSTWFMPVFNNSSVYASQWKFVCTSDSGAWSNEYWTRLLVEDYSGTSYTDTSIVSYSGYIVTYINSPGNAFGNDSNTAASMSGGSHINSTIFLTFPSAVRLNKLWIRTGYTKISGMTLSYYG